MGHAQQISETRHQSVEPFICTVCKDVGDGKCKRRSKDEDTGDQREDVEVDEMEDNLEDTATDGQDMDEPWDVPFKKVMMCSHLCCTDQAKADCEEVCCQSSPKRNNFMKKSNKVKRAKDVPEFMELREPYVGEP